MTSLLSLIHDWKHGLDDFCYAAEAISPCGHERRSGGLSGCKRGFRTVNRTASICIRFPSKPMSLLNLEMSGTWSNINLAAGN